MKILTNLLKALFVTYGSKKKASVSATFFHNSSRRSRAWENALWRAVALLLSLHYCLVLNLWQLSAQEPGLIRVDRTRYRGSAPSVSRRGVTSIVNIRKANRSGVSHNLFTDFNVGSGGLVLNNSVRRATSQLVGSLGANANLGGRSASLILNEVTGASSSSLKGTTEILGQRADYVLANANGIVCDGCGFSNASRVALSTGRAVLDADGGLSELQVKSGKVEIIGDGLDGGDADYFDIISRQASVASGASLQAEGSDLQFTLGANRVSYYDRRITGSTSAALSSGPSLDVAHLGGVEAERITLESTDKGVGVHMDGDMAAGSGGVFLSADGRMSIGDEVHVSSRGGSVALRSRNGGISVGSGSRLVAGASLSLETAGNIELSAGSSLRASVTASLGTQGDIINAGSVSADLVFLRSGVSASEGQVALSGSIVNRGEINASQWLEATTVGELENHGLLSAGLGYAHLRSEGRFHNEGSGRIEGIGGVSVSGEDFLNEDSSLFGGLSLVVRAEDTLESRGLGSRFVSAGLVSLSTSDGDIRLSDTYVGAGDRLYLQSGASLELSSSTLASVNQAAVLAQGDVDISESSLVSRRIHLQSERGNIRNRASRIETGAVDIASVLLSAGYDSDRLEGLLSLLAEARVQGLSDVAYTSEEVRALFEPELPGLYDADGGDGLLAVISGGDIINEEGGLLSGDRLYLDADGGSGSVYNLGLESVMASSSDLSFSVSSLINEGTLRSEQGLMVSADSISNSGAIRSGSTSRLSLSARESLENFQGPTGMVDGEDADVLFEAANGGLISGGMVSLTAGRLVNRGSSTREAIIESLASSVDGAPTLLLRVDELFANQGKAQLAGESLYLDVGRFENTGAFASIGGVGTDSVMVSSRGDVINQDGGRIAAGRSLSIVSSDGNIRTATGSSLFGGDTLSLLASSGDISLAGRLRSSADGRMAVSASGDLKVFAASLSGGTLSLRASDVLTSVDSHIGDKEGITSSISVVSSGNIHGFSSVFSAKDDIRLVAEGDLTLSSSELTSLASLSVQSRSGDVSIKAASSVSSGGDLSVSSLFGEILHTGNSVLESGASLSLRGASIRNEGSSIKAASSVSLFASAGSISNALGASLEAESGDLFLRSVSGDIVNEGGSLLRAGASHSLQIVSGGDFVLNSGEEGGGSVVEAGSLSISAEDVHISGSVGSLSRVESLSVGDDGEKDGFIAVRASNLLEHGAFSVLSASSLDLRAGSGGFINRGSIGDREASVSVFSSGDIRNLDGASLIARRLSLSVGEDGSIANLGEESEISSVEDLSLSGSFSLHNEGLIRSDSSLLFSLRSLENSGRIRSDSSLLFSLRSLENSGTISSGDALSLSSESIDNSGLIRSGDSSYAALSSSGDFRNRGTLSGGILDISALRFENLDSALIQSHLEDSSLGIRLAAGAGGFYNAGSLEAVASIEVHSLGDFESSGLFTSDSGSLSLSSLDAFSLTGGSRLSGEAVSLRSVNDGISISGGTEVSAVSLLDIRAAGSVDISSEFARLHVLLGDGQLNIKGSDISSVAKIDATRISLTSTSGGILNQGKIGVRGSFGSGIVQFYISLTSADDIVNEGALGTQGLSVVEIHADASFDNRGGRAYGSKLRAYVKEEIHIGEVEAAVTYLEARHVLRGDEGDSGAAYSLSAEEHLSIIHDPNLDASYFGALQTERLTLTSRLDNVRYDDFDPDSLHGSKGIFLKAAKSLLLSDITGKESVSLSGKDIVYLGGLEGEDRAIIEASKYKSISLDQGMGINKEGDELLHLYGQFGSDPNQGVTWDVSLKSSQGGDLEHLYLESFEHSVINHGQEISTSHSLSFVAKNNVVNLGGDLRSKDISLEAKIGDVLNKSLKEREYFKNVKVYRKVRRTGTRIVGNSENEREETYIFWEFVFSHWGKESMGSDAAACHRSHHGCYHQDKVTAVSGIHASGDLKINAGSHIKNLGGDVSAGVNAQLIAGGDIVFNALALEKKGWLFDGGRKWSYSKRFEKKTHRLATLSLSSGSSFIRTGDDFILHGVKVSSKGEGDLELDIAEDLHLLHVSDTDYAFIEERSIKGNWFIGRKKTATWSGHDSSTVRQSSFAIAGDIVINTGGNILLSGSTMSSGGDLRIGGQRVKRNGDGQALITEDGLNFQTEDGLGVVNLALLAAEGRNKTWYDTYIRRSAWGITYKEEKYVDKLEESTMTASEMVAQGNAIIQARGNVLLFGSDLKVEGDLNLEAETFVALSSQNTKETYHHEWVKRLTFDLSDFGAMLLNIGSGTAEGAAAGAALGPVGAAVGAVVGAISGLVKSIIAAFNNHEIDTSTEQERWLTHNLSSIVAGGDLNLNVTGGEQGGWIPSLLPQELQKDSSTDEEIKFSDMMVAGASFTSGGSMNVKVDGDLKIFQVMDTHTYQKQSANYRTAGLGMRTDQNQKQEVTYDETLRASLFQAGSDLNFDVSGNMLVSGSELKAERDLSVGVGRHLVITSAEERHITQGGSVHKRTTNVQGVPFFTTLPLMFGTTLENENKKTDIYQRASLLSAGQDLNVRTGGLLHILSSELHSGREQNIADTAKTVIGVLEEVHDYEETHSETRIRPKAGAWALNIIAGVLKIATAAVGGAAAANPASTALKTAAKAVKFSSLAVITLTPMIMGAVEAPLYEVSYDSTTTGTEDRLAKASKLVSETGDLNLLSKGDIDITGSLLCAGSSCSSGLGEAGALGSGTDSSIRLLAGGDINIFSAENSHSETETKRHFEAQLVMSWQTGLALGLGIFTGLAFDSEVLPGTMMAATAGATVLFAGMTGYAEGGNNKFLDFEASSTSTTKTRVEQVASQIRADSLIIAKSLGDINIISSDLEADSLSLGAEGNLHIGLAHNREESSSTKLSLENGQGYLEHSFGHLSKHGGIGLRITGDIDVERRNTVQSRGGRLSNLRARAGDLSLSSSGGDISLSTLGGEHGLMVGEGGSILINGQGLSEGELSVFQKEAHGHFKEDVLTADASLNLEANQIDHNKLSAMFGIDISKFVTTQVISGIIGGAGKWGDMPVLEALGAAGVGDLVGGVWTMAEMGAGRQKKGMLEGLLEVIGDMDGELQFSTKITKESYETDASGGMIASTRSFSEYANKEGALASMDLHLREGSLLKLFKIFTSKGSDDDPLAMAPSGDVFAQAFQEPRIVEDLGIVLKVDLTLAGTSYAAGQTRTLDELVLDGDFYLDTLRRDPGLGLNGDRLGATGRYELSLSADGDVDLSALLLGFSPEDKHLGVSVDDLGLEAEGRFDLRHSQDGMRADLAFERLHLNLAGLELSAKQVDANTGEWEASELTLSDLSADFDASSLSFGRLYRTGEMNVAFDYDDTDVSLGRIAYTSQKGNADASVQEEIAFSLDKLRIESAGDLVLDTGVSLNFLKSYVSSGAAPTGVKWRMEQLSVQFDRLSYASFDLKEEKEASAVIAGAQLHVVGDADLLFVGGGLQLNLDLEEASFALAGHDEAKEQANANGGQSLLPQPEHVYRSLDAEEGTSSALRVHELQILGVSGSVALGFGGGSLSFETDLGMKEFIFDYESKAVNADGETSETEVLGNLEAVTLETSGVSYKRIYTENDDFALSLGYTHSDVSLDLASFHLGVGSGNVMYKNTQWDAGQGKKSPNRAKDVSAEFSGLGLDASAFMDKNSLEVSGGTRSHLSSLVAELNSDRLSLTYRSLGYEDDSESRINADLYGLSLNLHGDVDASQSGGDKRASGLLSASLHLDSGYVDKYSLPEDSLTSLEFSGLDLDVTGQLELLSLSSSGANKDNGLDFSLLDSTTLLSLDEFHLQQHFTRDDGQKVDLSARFRPMEGGDGGSLPALRLALGGNINMGAFTSTASDLELVLTSVDLDTGQGDVVYALEDTSSHQEIEGVERMDIAFSGFHLSAAEGATNHMWFNFADKLTGEELSLGARFAVGLNLGGVTADILSRELSGKRTRKLIALHDLNLDLVGEANLRNQISGEHDFALDLSQADLDIASGILSSRALNQDGTVNDEASYLFASFTGLGLGTPAPVSITMNFADAKANVKRSRTHVNFASGISLEMEQLQFTQKSVSTDDEGTVTAGLLRGEELTGLRLNLSGNVGISSFSVTYSHEKMSDVALTLTSADLDLDAGIVTSISEMGEATEATTRVAFTGLAFRGGDDLFATILLHSERDAGSTDTQSDKDINLVLRSGLLNLYGVDLSSHSTDSKGTEKFMSVSLHNLELGLGGQISLGDRFISTDRDMLVNLDELDLRIDSGTIGSGEDTEMAFTGLHLGNAENSIVSMGMDFGDKAQAKEQGLRMSLPGMHLSLLRFHYRKASTEDDGDEVETEARLYNLDIVLSGELGQGSLVSDGVDDADLSLDLRELDLSVDSGRMVYGRLQDGTMSREGSGDVGFTGLGLSIDIGASDGLRLSFVASDEGEDNSGLDMDLKNVALRLEEVNIHEFQYIDGYSGAYGFGKGVISGADLLVSGGIQKGILASGGSGLDLSLYNLDLSAAYVNIDMEAPYIISGYKDKKTNIVFEELSLALAGETPTLLSLDSKDGNSDFSARFSSIAGMHAKSFVLTESFGFVTSGSKLSYVAKFDDVDLNLAGGAIYIGGVAGLVGGKDRNARTDLFLDLTPAVAVRIGSFDFWYERYYGFSDEVRTTTVEADNIRLDQALSSHAFIAVDFTQRHDEGISNSFLLALSDATLTADRAHFHHERDKGKGFAQHHVFDGRFDDFSLRTGGSVTSDAGSHTRYGESGHLGIELAFGDLDLASGSFEHGGWYKAKETRDYDYSTTGLDYKDFHLSLGEGGVRWDLPYLEDESADMQTQILLPSASMSVEEASFFHSRTDRLGRPSTHLDGDFFQASLTVTGALNMGSLFVDSGHELSIDLSSLSLNLASGRLDRENYQDMTGSSSETHLDFSGLSLSSLPGHRNRLDMSSEESDGSGAYLGLDLSGVSLGMDTLAFHHNSRNAVDFSSSEMKVTLEDLVFDLDATVSMGDLGDEEKDLVLALEKVDLSFAGSDVFLKNSKNPRESSGWTEISLTDFSLSHPEGVPAAHMAMNFANGERDMGLKLALTGTTLGLGEVDFTHHGYMDDRIASAGGSLMTGNLHGLSLSLDLVLNKGDFADGARDLALKLTNLDLRAEGGTLGLGPWGSQVGLDETRKTSAGFSGFVLNHAEALYINSSLQDSPSGETRLWRAGLSDLYLGVDDLFFVQDSSRHSTKEGLTETMMSGNLNHLSLDDFNGDFEILTGAGFEIQGRDILFDLSVEAGEVAYTSATATGKTKQYVADLLGIRVEDASLPELEIAMKDDKTQVGIVIDRFGLEIETSSVVAVTSKGTEDMRLISGTLSGLSLATSGAFGMEFGEDRFSLSVADGSFALGLDGIRDLSFLSVKGAKTKSLEITNNLQMGLRLYAEGDMDLFSATLSDGTRMIDAEFEDMDVGLDAEISYAITSDEGIKSSYFAALSLGLNTSGAVSASLSDEGMELSAALSTLSMNGAGSGLFLKENEEEILHSASLGLDFALSVRPLIMDLVWMDDRKALGLYLEEVSVSGDFIYYDVYKDEKSREISDTQMGDFSTELLGHLALNGELSDEGLALSMDSSLNLRGELNLEREKQIQDGSKTYTKAMPSFYLDFEALLSMSGEVSSLEELGEGQESLKSALDIISLDILEKKE